MKKLLSIIGDFFTSLFGGAKKTWKKLSPEVQAALLNGSGIIEIINTNVDEAPDFVIELIQKAFPNLDIEKLKDGLHQAALGLTVAESINNADLQTTIENLQAYLKGLQGTTWAKISQALALGIAAALAPPTTKFAAISSLIEFVYHSFIKKSK